MPLSAPPIASPPGIWAGSYVEPWFYRACVRLGGRPASCSGEAMRTLAVITIS
jgi:hypothetical protein